MNTLKIGNKIMNIEINIDDYLSKEEIKEECKCAIRHLIYNTYNNESRIDTLISNLSYEFLFKQISKCIDKDAETLIRNNVIELLENGTSIKYELFRKPNAWDREASVGYKILQQAIKDSENLIREKVTAAINDYDFGNSQEIYDKIMDCITSIIDDRLLRPSVNENIPTTSNK